MKKTKIELSQATPVKVKKLVWNMLDILEAVGVPVDGTDRSLERMAKACLAVGGITRDFKDASISDERRFLRTRDIIDFEKRYYGENISPGSYDDVRRKDLKLLVEAGVVVSSSSTKSQAVNNPSRGYALSKSFIKLIRDYKTDAWKESLNEYIDKQVSLKEELKRLRELERIPVKLADGSELRLSYGEHNVLQKAIIEQFLPRFGFEAAVLYVGDTEDKFMYMDQNSLESIHFFELNHEMLPDIVAYSKEKNLLYLIEAFHSTGEWNEIRLRTVVKKLQESGCTAIPVFFTAFETKAIFRQKAKDIAWETEVWLADNPDHLIHFNGSKFLEIHK